jgi:hypothetical protein
MENNVRYDEGGESYLDFQSSLDSNKPDLITPTESLKFKIQRTYKLNWDAKKGESAIKYDEEIKSLQEILKDNPKDLSDEILKVLNRQSIEFCPVNLEDNLIKKIHVTHLKKDKPLKEYYIKKGLKFELIKNNKRRRCIVEGFYPYTSAFDKELDKNLNPRNQILVKIRYLTNNRIGKAKFLSLIPYGHAKSL